MEINGLKFQKSVDNKSYNDCKVRMRNLEKKRVRGQLKKINHY